MHGALEPDFKLGDKLEDDEMLRKFKEASKREKNFEPSMEMRYHAAALVYDQSWLSNDEVNKMMKEVISRFTRHGMKSVSILIKGMQPILILTKVDNLDIEASTEPSNKRPIIQNHIAAISNELGIPRQNIKVSYSYSDSTERNCLIDRHNLCLFSEVLDTADEYICAKMAQKRSQK